MANEKPQSRPEAPDPARRAIYGGQWGSSGKQSDADTGHSDRPEPIDPSSEPNGSAGPEAD
jgi:hypothetical protein